MAVRIQLALQGGGAKLCGLLAALEAVQELEHEGVLEVTRLAGTSAGSIAAALYAANVPLAGIRERIIDNRSRLEGLFPQPTFWRLALLAIFGRPIVDLSPLQKVLREALKGNPRFGELEKRLIVVATDITNGKTQKFDDPDDFVVNAVVDSCAIPFYFRGPGKKNANALLVDGGICENLPVDFLRKFDAKDGQIIGITFRPGSPGVTPSGLRSFSKALLDAAMNNSVRRAQLQLGDDRLLSLKTDIDTLDFARALNEGMGASYDLTRNDSEKFFRGICAPASQAAPKVVVEAGPESEQSDTTLQRVADLYAAQYSRIKMRYAEARMIVRIGALSTDKETSRARPDHLSYRLQFAAGKEPLPCATLQVTDRPDAEFLKTVRRQVRDRNNEVVQTIDLLGRDKSHPNVRLYLLFFHQIIQPDDPRAPLTLEYAHQVQDLMAPLEKEGRDFISFRTTRSEGPTPRVVLVALIPETHPNLGIRRSFHTTVEGRRMSDAELHLLDLPLEDHYALGWIGENVEPGQTFAAEIFRPILPVS